MPQPPRNPRPAQDGLFEIDVPGTAGNSNPLSGYEALAQQYPGGVWEALVARGEIDPGWAQALAPVSGQINTIMGGLAAEERSGGAILPPADRILTAFTAPFAEVRVLILGQDPYPTPGHAMGLSFSVTRNTRPLPRSLANLYKELHADLGLTPAAHGDLSAWTAQGVLLLNRVLTVGAGAAGSHRRRGWEAVTETALRALSARRRPDGTPVPLVAVLWGKDAQAAQAFLPDATIIASAHPSPLSASRGFFGSRPFSRVNAALEAAGEQPVIWSLLPAA